MKRTKGPFHCPVEATLALIGGKHKPLLLWHLIEGPRHYMELQRLVPGATAKMLSQQRWRATGWCGGRCCRRRRPGPATLSLPSVAALSRC